MPVRIFAIFVAATVFSTIAHAGFIGCEQNIKKFNSSVGFPPRPSDVPISEIKIIDLREYEGCPLMVAQNMTSRFEDKNVIRFGVFMLSDVMQEKGQTTCFYAKGTATGVGTNGIPTLECKL